MPAPRNGSSPNARELEGKWRSRPISRVLSWAIIRLGLASPQGSSNLPGDTAGRSIASLFGLTPDGVCRAGRLPGSRCALTAPFHPCRSAEANVGGIFLLHFPSALTAQALPGIAPCGDRTFLDACTPRLPGRLRAGIVSRLRVTAIEGVAWRAAQVCRDFGGHRRFQVRAQRFVDAHAFMQLRVFGF